MLFLIITHSLARRPHEMYPEWAELSETFRPQPRNQEMGQGRSEYQYQFQQFDLFKLIYVAGGVIGLVIALRKIKNHCQRRRPAVPQTCANCGCINYNQPQQICSTNLQRVPSRSIRQHSLPRQKSNPAPPKPQQVRQQFIYDYPQASAAQQRPPSRNSQTRFNYMRMLPQTGLVRRALSRAGLQEYEMVGVNREERGRSQESMEWQYTGEECRGTKTVIGRPVR